MGFLLLRVLTLLLSLAMLGAIEARNQDVMWTLIITSIIAQAMSMFAGDV